MLLIDASNAEEYLRRTGRIGPEEEVIVRELAGGVSNIVLLLSRSTSEPRFVLKQVREQLRVPDPWFCSIERIWREVDVLQVCHRALDETPAIRLHPGEPTIAVPRVLFSDRENYLFAMSAAPDHEVWKAQLLRGETCLATAAACGRLLGTIHAATWQQRDLAKQLGDTSFFDALRLDPYYRHVARAHADLASALQHLVASLAEHPRCLVHGDFSPKNILVHPGGLTLVDFEVGHFGDPAFDLGFFLSHVVLKAIRARDGWWDFWRLTFTFWNQYMRSLMPVCGASEYAALVGRGIENLAGCLLARVDGKSRVDYLDSFAQETVRGFARDLLFRLPATWPEVAARYVNVVRKSKH